MFLDGVHYIDLATNMRVYTHRNVLTAEVYIRPNYLLAKVDLVRKDSVVYVSLSRL